MTLKLQDRPKHLPEASASCVYGMSRRPDSGIINKGNFFVGDGAL